MKILVVSDTHKKHKNLERVLERVAPIDLLIHLGDAEGYEEDIAHMAGCPLEIVAGNNDYFSRLEKEKILEIGKYRILITHGHYYYVGSGIQDLVKEAAGRNIDIIMFGHTHRPLIEYLKNVVVINPGSISYPRQEGRQPSYIIMELDRNGEAHFSLHYL